MRSRPAKTRAALVAAATIVSSALVSPSFAQYEVPNPIYAAPGSYYSTATATDGPTLKTQLNAIIDGHTQRTYSSAAGDNALLKLDEDPNNTSNVLLVYNGVSIAKSSVLNVNYNREHLWCNSYGIDDTNKAYSDLFNLRVCDANVNSDRNNDYYDDGGTTANPEAPECNQIPGTSWEPRPIEKGDIARSMFYMDTRYSGDADDDFARDLTLTSNVASITTSNNNMGNLATLLHWHYQDGVSNAERKRNHLIYTSDTGANGWNGTAYNQGNRNPFVDHPEWVWAAFGGGANNSKLYVGATPGADGSSSTTASLRVMKNGTWGTTNVVLTKLGTNPTTYDLTAGGSATSAATGPGQAFDYNTQQRTISVSLNASTATTGLKTGTLTMDNTDITTGGTALGSADGNDTINVNGQVVDNRVITATPAAFGRVVIGANVTTSTNLSSPGSDNDNTRVTVKGTASAADSNGVFITAGTDRTYNGTITTGSRNLQANFATAGSKSGSRPFVMQGEGLTGESVNALSASYTATAVEHAQPSLASGSSVSSDTVDFGYVPSGFAARTTNFTVYNNASPSGATLTAGLDVDGKVISGSSAMTDNVVASNPASPLAAGASGWTYTATFTPGGADNNDAATHTINVSDENIPGAAARPSLTFTTNGRTVTSAGNFPATGFINLLTGETFNTTAMSIAGGVTLTKTGPGTMNVNGTQANGANSTLSVSQGSVQLNSDAGSNLGVSVAAGATATLGSDQHLRDLSITGQVNVADGDHMIVTNSLSQSGSGTMDLRGSKLVAKNTAIGSWNGSAYTGLSGLVQQGRGDGSWNGAGLVTSKTNATTGVLTTLAIASADDLGVAGSAWYGEPVSSGDALVMYTWGGDADLNGSLDGDDYFFIDANIVAQEPGFHNGDFDYNGVIDGDDYFIIDSNIGFAQASGGPPPSLAAVPEPASLALLLAAPLLARRRRGTR